MSQETISNPLMEEVLKQINIKKAIYLARVNEAENDRYYKLFDDIMRKASDNNKERFANYNVHDLFLFIFLRRNRSAELTYNDAVALLEPSFNAMDKWRFEDVQSLFNKLEDHFNDKGKMDLAELENAITSLRLPKDIMLYDLSNVFLTIRTFLDFKKRVNDIRTGKNQTINPIAMPVPINTGLNKFGSFPSIPNIPIKKSKKEQYDDAFYTTIDHILSFFQEHVSKEREIDEQENEYDKIALNLLRKYSSESFLTTFIEPEEDFYRCVEDETGELTELLMRLSVFNIATQYQERSLIADKLEKEITSSKLREYLYNQEINPNSIPLLSEYETKEDIIEILEFLKKLGINPGTALLSYKNIIDFLNIDIIKEIGTLIEIKAISLNTLLINFNYISTHLEELKAKIQILSKYIKFDDIFYNESILFESLDEIRNRILIISEYNTIKNLKHIQTYLLCNIDKLYILDLLLEHNIPILLFISICKTSNPLDTIKKIIICQSISEPYLKGNALKSDVTMPNKFLVPDSMLDQYLGNYASLYSPSKPSITKYDPSIKEDTSIKELETCLIEEGDTYTNGDIYISKPKFLRAYSTLKDPSHILSCLLENSIATQSECQKLIFDIAPTNFTLK